MLLFGSPLLRKVDAHHIHVDALDLVFRHRLNVVLDRLLNLKRDVGHAVTVIGIDGYIRIDAVLFEIQLEAFFP